VDLKDRAPGKIKVMAMKGKMKGEGEQNGRKEEKRGVLPTRNRSVTAPLVSDTPS